jgi:hypothetical protein
MKLLDRFHIHPYLIGLFPVLSLYAHNQSQLQSDAVWRSLAVIISGTSLVFIILRSWFRDWDQAAFITSYASLIFFLYNPVREIFYKIHSSNFNLGWNRYFFPLWLFIFILGVWLIVKKLSGNRSTIRLFNLIALSTIFSPSISIVSYLINHSEYAVTKGFYTSAGQNRPVTKVRPDIYYIVLDMYGRSDTIEDEFGYDNSQFLGNLRKQGFYVASCSTSNYSHTVLSMASSLNMNFLPALGDDFVPGNTDYSNAGEIIERNAVRQFLYEHGYSFASFESDFPHIDIPDADIYLTLSDSPQKASIYPFELLLIEQTPIRIFVDEIISYNSKAVESAPIRLYGPSYDQTLFMFEKLAQLPTTLPAPKFVYAHFIIPHPPYVFGPDGEYVGNDKRLNGGPNHAPVDEEAYHLGYINQVRYVDSVMPTLLNQLISRSAVHPIIIVQGDHGFWGVPEKRLPILNAYYLPGKDASQLLYPGITPVNSFRVVLNAYFGSQFGLLPDEKYPTVNDEDFYNVERMDEDAIRCKPK